MAILAPTHENVEVVNDYVLTLISWDEKLYLSSDEVSKDYTSVGARDLHSTEFLNSIRCSGLPNHQLRLKVGDVVMLLRNIDQSRGLCNGTRLIVIDLGTRVIRCTVLTGSHKGDRVHIARLTLTPSHSTKFLVRFNRRQFPIAVCFAMTINKSQDQSLSQNPDKKKWLLPQVATPSTRRYLFAGESATSWNLIEGRDLVAIEAKIAKYEEENKEQIAEERAAAAAAIRGPAFGDTDMVTDQSTQTGVSITAQGQYAPAISGGAFMQPRPMGMAHQPLPLGGPDLNLDDEEMTRLKAERGGRAGGWTPKFGRKRALEEAFGSLWL
ncbi:hypothetical protein KSS87_019209 [Heliosperma pusillum]|nr:hypothetical protein KSS87_019209 [Heliosperma pusillum]